MKKMNVFTFLALGMGCFCFAEEASSECTNAELVAQVQSNAAAAPQPGCAQLPADQQNFAMQLMKPDNKMMFCSKFSMDQRKSAMQMMGTPGPNGAMMNADQCVESVAQKNNMMMTPSGAGATGTSQTPKRGQGCPVRSQ